MNEMDVLTRLRAEVPAAVSPRAEEKYLAGARAPARDRTGARRATAFSRTAARLRAIPVRWRLAIAGGLTLALTAGLLGAATAHLGGGKPPASANAADLLATRAAAAAAARPAVSPGQWIYRQRLDRTLGHGMLCLSPGRHPVSGTCPSRPLKFEGWSTADGTRSAWFYGGKLIRGGGAPVPVRYADLGTLPRDPAAIVAYIAKKWAYPKTGGGPASAAFQGISALLDNYVLPPTVAAELYRALAGIPGVTVNPHATDLAGRHGPAFTLRVKDRPGYDVFELILDPHTYTLMGFTEATHGVTTRDRHVHLVFGSEVAILRQMPVSGPGVRP
jgi:hypothetical protein